MFSLYRTEPSKAKKETAKRERRFSLDSPINKLPLFLGAGN
jgi:hypothetical protein